MPLTTTIQDDRSIKREALAFDVSGDVTFSSGVTSGGGGGTGPQGPQGPQGEGLNFPTGSQGQVIYVGPDGKGKGQEWFKYNETIGSLNIETTPTGNNFPLTIENGAQGVNSVSANVMRYKVEDELLATPTENHGMVIDYAGRAYTGAPVNYSRQVIGYDGDTNRRSQVATYVYDFETNRTSEFIHHTRFQRRTHYHTATTGLHRISETALFTPTPVAVANGFGQRHQYTLQTGTTTPTRAVSQSFLWRDATNGLSQYNLEVADFINSSSAPDLTVQESYAQNTKFTGWTATVNNITNTLAVEANHVNPPTGRGDNSGVSLTFLNKSTTTVGREQGAIEGYWITAADASRVGALRLRATDTVSSTGLEISKYNLGLPSSHNGTRITPVDSVNNTNTFLMLTPKGTGGIVGGIVQAGSAAVGTNSIDICFDRTASTRARGGFSTIIGGGTNDIGTGGTYAAILGGKDNLVQSPRAAIVGGLFNRAIGENSFAIGKRARASQANSFAIASGEQTENSWDSVGIQIVLRNQTSGTAILNLLNDGAALTQPDISMWIIDALIVGRGSAINNNWAYRLVGAHRRESGTTGSLVGAPVVQNSFESSALTPPSLVSASGQPIIRVNGASGLTVKWVAYLTITQVIY